MYEMPFTMYEMIRILQNAGMLLFFHQKLVNLHSYRRCIMKRRLVFASHTEILRLPAESLVYVMADGNYSAITMADRERYVVTLQLGQIERIIAENLETADNRFIRIGKSLIVNRDFIVSINIQRQKMILSDCRSFRHEVTASKEALNAMKELLEKEETQ